MDISLLVMVSQIALSPYRRGDIIDVSLLHSEPCSHSRFALIHVLGVPNNAPPKKLIKRFKMMLERAHMTVAFNDEIRRRQWRIDYRNLPASVKQEILANREYTVSWSQAKNYIGKRVVTDESDPDSDTLVFIRDEDA